MKRAQRGRPAGPTRRRPNPEALKRARRRAGLRALDVGPLIGVEPNSIYDYECGRSAPCLSQVDRMARLYGCRIETLYRRSRATPNADRVSSRRT